MRSRALKRKENDPPSRTREPPAPLRRAKEKLGKRPGDDAPAHIRCPACGWRHDWKKHWGCDGCRRAIFDTFVTRATCPECGKTWRETQCPSCGKMTPHVDWYVVDE